MLGAPAHIGKDGMGAGGSLFGGPKVVAAIVGRTEDPICLLAKVCPGPGKRIGVQIDAVRANQGYLMVAMGERLLDRSGLAASEIRFWLGPPVVDFALSKGIMGDPLLDGSGFGGGCEANGELFPLTLSEPPADFTDESFVNGYGFGIADVGSQSRLHPSRFGPF